MSVLEYTENTENTESEEKRSELDSLIQILKDGIKKDEPGIRFIRFPKLLVEALEELNNLVGLHRLKDSVALQTVRLIENLKNGETSAAMLNTILTGPPGVGKSRAGVILAKIWFALGFLNRNAGTTIKTTKNFFGEAGGDPKDMGTIVLLLILWGGTYIIQAMSYAYQKMGLYWFAFILSFLILVAILVYWSDPKTEWVNKYFTEEITEEKIKQISDRDIISVVSRNDFVGEYLGHTAGKTKKLLEANLGKVVFIDEAYSLLNDVRDAYGFECLNTLNLFLSENPDKIVVILAGYRDQMKASIFAAQPGLERRMMWNISCDPYNGEELSEIFFLQAEKENWEISREDRVKIRKLIIRNESSFKAYGGDTERLLYLSSLEASRSHLSINDSFLSSEVKGKPKKVLTFKNVESGLVTLQENNFN